MVKNSDIAAKPILHVLASYPKSGNTWVRAFLTALRNVEKRSFGEKTSSNSTGSVEINRLAGVSFVDRTMVETRVGLDSADLSQLEIAHLRKEAINQFKEKLTISKDQNRGFLKIHNINAMPIRTGDAVPFLDFENIDGVVYIVRNPLDTCISYANHAGTTIDSAIKDLSSNEQMYTSWATQNYVTEQLSGWSAHVKSWCKNKDFNPLIVRYEDMSKQPTLTFAKLAKFLGFCCSAGEVEQAIQQVSFDKLKQQEQKLGFNESQINTGGFFYKGLVGHWQSVLSTPQFQAIINDHGEVMHELGYLDENHKPTELMCGS